MLCANDRAASSAQAAASPLSLNGRHDLGHASRPGHVLAAARTTGGLGVMRIVATREPGRGRLIGLDASAQRLLRRARLALHRVQARAAQQHLAMAILDAVDIAMQVTWLTGTPPEGQARAGDADLALFLVLASLVSNRPLGVGLVAAAGVDAAGRLRPVAHWSTVVAVARAVGASTVVMASAVASGSVPEPGAPVRCLWLATVDDALRGCLTGPSSLRGSM